MADIKNNKDGSRTVTVTVAESFDQGLLDALVRQLERGAGNQFVVGNLADLQRAGAEVVAAGQGAPGKGSGFAAGVNMHPDVDLDDAKSGAQRTLDEEEAAKNPEPLADPPDSDEPLTPVDPGSQSPQPASSAKKK